MGKDNHLNRWTTLAHGTFVASIVLPEQGERHDAIELLLQAPTRQEALTRLHAMGYHSIRFKGHHRAPPQSDIQAIAEHEGTVLWRRFADGGPWHPFAAPDA